MKSRRTVSFKIVSLSCFSVVLGLGFARVHLRMQTTLIGYELGELKFRENSLIEALSTNRVELAKLTAKSTLQLLSVDSRLSKNLGAYAAK